MTAAPATQPPPPPPAPRSPEAVAAENAALAGQVANDALRSAAEAGRAAEARRSPMGVIRDGDGRIVVTGPDGRAVTIDPGAVGDEDAVREMVQTALAPAPAPRSSGPTGGDVAIVSIIFPCLIVIMLIVWRIVATAKRAAPGGGAAAAAAPELAARLTRIEQAIEAVAIEVERIAESERYSARLLTERLPDVQPARAAAGQALGQAPRAETPTADVPR